MRLRSTPDGRRSAIQRLGLGAVPQGDRHSILIYRGFVWYAVIIVGPSLRLR